MAYRGSRSIVSGRGGDTLKVHFVDTSADLPAASRCRAGDTAFCIAAGGEDGNQWVVKKSSAGLSWASAGAGSTLSLEDLTVTNNARLAKLYVSAGSMEFYADDTAGTLGCGVLSAPRTWTLADRSGTVVTHAAGVIAGLPLESEIDFASPSGDGTLTVKNSLSTNKGRLRTTGGLAMFNADPMPAQLGALDDLPAFSDPPTAGEMAALRAFVNRQMAALRAGTGIGAIAAA